MDERTNELTNNANSHWLQPDLDPPGCCLFSDDLILIVLTIYKNVEWLSAFMNLSQLEQYWNATERTKDT